MSTRETTRLEFYVILLFIYVQGNYYVFCSTYLPTLWLGDWKYVNVLEAVGHKNPCSHNPADSLAFQINICKQMYFISFIHKSKSTFDHMVTLMGSFVHKMTTTYLTNLNMFCNANFRKWRITSSLNSWQPSTVSRLACFRYLPARPCCVATSLNEYNTAARAAADNKDDACVI
jgi:hypothetical protein